MAKETINNDLDFEPEPIENPSTELAKILQEGDPDVMLAILEKKATLASRMTKALNTLLITCTYPEDWKEFSGTMGLKSAAAERIARHFDIRFSNVSWKKEDFTDGNGKGYRYIYEGEASMGNRVIFAQGVYSTRDKFLGYANEQWRAVEDINENHIRNAAYHIFMGNGVKALLGLRGIPKERFDEMMKGAGEDGNKSGKVNYGKGTQGGTTQDDQTAQKELAEILIAIANSGYGIAVNSENGQHYLQQTSEIEDPIEVAKDSCKALTSFYNKTDKKLVAGLDSAKLVKGKRLEIALQNAKKMQSEMKGGQ